jgi:KilA-N domain
MSTNRIIKVKGTEINVILKGNEDFISLTDMIKPFGDDSIIKNWLRNRNTVEFLGIWEQLNNPVFNSVEFDLIKSQTGLNSFVLSVKRWTESTLAIGLVAKTGRYGSGTFAHKDIAFEFGSWLSPEFKLYLLKEFQRLKEDENDRLKLDWNLQRTLAKVNYRIHTDAIKENLIPKELTRNQINFVYASEADLLNMALFGITAKDWREANPKAEGNMRDAASIEQLVVLSNMESINAVLIHQGLKQSERLMQLNKIAITQMKSLMNNRQIGKLK